MSMNIDWWVIDGIVVLIILAAAIRGAVKGIGDTILRIAAVAGGAVLAFLYSDKVSAYLKGTSMASSLHEHIFSILRGGAGADQAGAAGAEALSGEAEALGTEGGSSLPGLISGNEDSLFDSLSKSLTGLFTDAADKAADAAASRLTDVAVNIISVALIILAVALAASLIRALIRRGRKRSLVLGFTDRVLGFVLGGVRGLLLAWIAVALLIPVTTIVSPLNLTGMISALQETTIARVLYDVNPLLFLVKILLKS